MPSSPADTTGPPCHSPRAFPNPSLPPPQHITPRDVRQVQPMTTGEQISHQTTTNWNHFHFQSNRLLQLKSRLTSYVIFFLSLLYLFTCVCTLCTQGYLCIQMHMNLSLSNMNILYVRAVNIPWSCVCVFFKISYLHRVTLTTPLTDQWNCV